MRNQKHKKPKNFDFDLLVIGSGPAGGVSAHLAARAGARVGLVEENEFGGTSAFYGTIPTRALLEAADSLWRLKKVGQHGIRSSSQSFNYRAVQLWKQKVLYATGVLEESEVFNHEKIQLIKGRAHFISPWIITIGLRRYSAKKIIIATGSEPRIPNIAGLAEVGYLTYKTASNLEKVPRSLFIIGGGRIAYEFGQIFSAFDSRVHIALPANLIFPLEDVEVNDSAIQALEARGVKVHPDTSITSISMHGGKKIVALSRNGQMHRIVTDDILIAGEEMPSVDLGLENTGVSYTEKGIKVNEYLQTTKKHIYAVGSVNGITMGPEASFGEARLAIHNLFSQKQLAYPFTTTSRVIYGMPQVATVGVTEASLKRITKKYQVGIAPIELIGSVRTNDYSGGFVKIIASSSGIIEGASVVSPNASEVISELSLAIASGIKANILTNLPHPFSSESSAVQIAASQIKIH